MKTKAAGIPKAFDQYTQEEIDLILSLTPTDQNVKNLAKGLGRSDDAIRTIYEAAYSGQWLKKSLARNHGGQDNVFTKIGRAKKTHGIFVGHRP